MEMDGVLLVMIWPGGAVLTAILFIIGMGLFSRFRLSAEN
jgi:hypothetical protein